MKLQLLADGCRLPHPLSLPASSTRMVVLARPAWLNGIMQVQHINDVSVFWCSRGMQGAEGCTGSLRDLSTSTSLTGRSPTKYYILGTRNPDFGLISGAFFNYYYCQASAGESLLFL